MIEAMRVIICGSISAAKEIMDAKKQLEEMEHEVEIPEGVKTIELRRIKGTHEEKAEVKIKHDLIRQYYEKMKLYEAVLIVNPKKKDIEGYIGGNTLIEMAFAHILGKKLYCLYPIPDLPYTSEIVAMRPIILNGNLNEIWQTSSNSFTV